MTAQEPENLEAGLALARACQRIGERIEAFREYQRVLRVAPDNGEAQRGLASLRGRS